MNLSKFFKTIMTRARGKPKPLESTDPELASLLMNYTNAVQKRVAQKHLSHKANRNDPCPCGSGKKYKKCCGRNS